MPRGSARLRTTDARQNLSGQRVREGRKALKLSQPKLCERLLAATDGSWNPTIYDLSRIEGGRRIVSDIELSVLAQALECSPCWLLTGEEPAKSVGDAPS
ncbi:helix-turn-helix domain-containing protein [Armatimonas sp.]|uniref:helix-turn-helix domain-containing protein n=1 Tax=Armatimonas sp. TaxID=1872638 RepID=UPI00374FFD24